MLKLTKKRSKWVENRSTTLKGTKLSYNAAIQKRYVDALERLVNSMTTETKKEVTRLFKGNISNEFFKNQKEISAADASLSSNARILMNQLTKKFSQLFSSRSSSLAQNMIKATTRTSTSTVHKSLEQLTGGLSLKTSIVPKGQEEVTTALLAENVSLIKSIPQKYFKDITGSVMRSITSGRGLTDLIPELQKYEKQTARSSELVALDQTRKAYNAINEQKLKSLGVKKFEWGHTGGSLHPRESHLAIEGHVFSFENIEAEQAALGVPPSDRGMPGYPPYCRCYMIPVIEFDTDE